MMTWGNLVGGTVAVLVAAFGAAAGPEPAEAAEVVTERVVGLVG